MAKPSSRPLTVAEAKQQLRGSAEKMGVESYIQQYPFASLFIAFGGGILLSDRRFSDVLARSGLSYLSMLLSHTEASDS